MHSFINEHTALILSAHWRLLTLKSPSGTHGFDLASHYHKAGPNPGGYCFLPETTIKISTPSLSIVPLTLGANLVKHSNGLNVTQLLECGWGHADVELTGLRLYRRKNKCMKLTTRNTTFQTITSRLHLYRVAHTMKRPHPVRIKDTEQSGFRRRYV